MSDLTPQIAAEVLAACQAGAEEAAGALSRSLDGEFTIDVGEAGTYTADSLQGPGLAVLMKFSGEGFAAFIPESAGLLPEWYADPDPTGASKLSTLGQELSMLLVPETLMADDFQVERVESIAESLAVAGVVDAAAAVDLTIKSASGSSSLTLVWPLARPDNFFPAPKSDHAAEAPPVAAAASGESARARPRDFRLLPSYSRSLLKIEVPVRVELASKRETVKELVELATGSIIKFDKSCEEMLRLFVGDQLIAEGEAVKVGDKFGFRVNHMLLPHEHFLPVRPRNAG
jgi:flagellar motor switch protein FliN/FliY